MTLELLQYCTLTGPAFSEPFVKFELEKELNKAKLLTKITGKAGKEIETNWTIYRRKLRELATMGGEIRVRNHVIEPLLKELGYNTLESANPVLTREGSESGGYLLKTEDNSGSLRVWCSNLEEDLDAPTKRGAAYRFSHLRVAQRVLLTCGERVGLLTNGVELRLLISDLARPDSQIIIPLDPYWKQSRTAPDTYRLVLALASPGGIKLIPELVEKARLLQATVTKDLRLQARKAIRLFIQDILEHPANRNQVKLLDEKLAKQLWQEGLIIIYRLLFILKLETIDDNARLFRFASSSLWRNTFSPSVALAKYVREVLDKGTDTGSLLEDGLRGVFRMFEEGIECTELMIKPLGGALFGENATPILSQLQWGEWAIAHLLDQLLWTTPKRKGESRQRVHYGTLSVEDLGRVYEALLELEPGIATEPMCRLRRQKLEVVVPVDQGIKYRPVETVSRDGDEELDSEEENENKKKTKVEWIEQIDAGKFYLRAGLGRKSTGSYYTPNSFVRFLVQETLGELVQQCSPSDDPNPMAILQLKVIDSAMGSGQFLVEACRFLGDKLYEACRECDGRIMAAGQKAETGDEAAILELSKYRQRLIDLSDPKYTPESYLPSHSPEGKEAGVSEAIARAICRRLVAVHCLYGVDKNFLACQLAKLSLWLETHAEGLPLTFLDHRLVVGDSLTGPFFEHLLKYPRSQEDIDPIYKRGIREGFEKAMREALKYVKDLEATVGVDLSDLQAKQIAKGKLDRVLAPLKIVAAAWSGGVMLGGELCDDVAYSWLLQAIGETRDLPEDLAKISGFGVDKSQEERFSKLLGMIAKGLGVKSVPSRRDDLYSFLSEEFDQGRLIPALPYDLTFAEVFYPDGDLSHKKGFHAALGNPPWDAIQFKSKEFLASFNIAILDAPTKREREKIEKELMCHSECAYLFQEYKEEFERQKRANDILYKYQKVHIEGDLAGRQVDAFRVFMEQNTQIIQKNGLTSVIVPSGFHANEGATGVRKLYLENMALKCCYSFENRYKLFEIHLSFKFATVIAQKGKITTEFLCAFYLHDEQWLFERKNGRQALIYNLDFVRQTGGEYLSLLELQSEKDLEIAKVCFANGEPFGKVCNILKIKFGRECDMSNDSWRFTSTFDILPEGKDPRDPDVVKELLNLGYLVLHEGKTFHQYIDNWEASPQYLIELNKIKERQQWLHSTQFFRLAFRKIASSTNERTLINCLLPPQCLTSDSTYVEQNSGDRKVSSALMISAIISSFTTDFITRKLVSANVNLFILNRIPIPDIQNQPFITFLTHSALRLTCNHKGYDPLWKEQLGNHWREPNKDPFTYPILTTNDERWHIRAQIDAVVAQVYGLNREQYAHILSTFSHKTYPNAPQLCLMYFDELQNLSLEEYTQKYDPYHDIPLNENLPQPVIQLPGYDNNIPTKGEFQLTPPPNEKPKKKRKK